MYFTLKELVYSDAAISRKIDNVPSWAQVLQLHSFVICCLDPVRILWGAPIKVNSGYRSPALNKAIGGVKGSYHQCILGFAAADITTGTQEGNIKLFELIQESSIRFVELILEQGGKWIHIAWHADRNDREISVS